LSRTFPLSLPRAARLAAAFTALFLAFAFVTAGADSVATVVPSDGLRLRAGPGTDHKVLDIVPGGTRLGIVGSATADGWYPTVYRGQRGWVNASYLAWDDAAASSARRAVVMPADGLNLRAAPSESADIITTMASGAGVVLAGQPTTDGWALVSVGERQGWVKASYLASEGTPVLNTSSSPVLAAPAVAFSAASAAPAGSTPVTVRYYSTAFEGSRLACGGTFRADDVTVAATNSWPCGTTLRVCTATACVTVTVRDKGGMAANEIDLSPAGFAKLSALSAGQITATAEVVGP
jgi:uncharacterized protein YraI